ncbi:hypothetical protein BU15DRAFT_74379 [Melanogaster broomeanus]|nr:hypothetical protein BU15DRAFT_74379 [Melanogaster broomeanus]
MDNIPLSPSFPPVTRSHAQSDDGSDDDDEVVRTPTKRSRYREEGNGGRTPRPGANTGAGLAKVEPPTLGFTLSHLRRVPELALLAARVVRAEARRREKAERDQERQKAKEKARSNGHIAISQTSVKPSVSQAKSMTSYPKSTTSRNENDKGRPPLPASTSMLSSTAPTDPPRKKMKRLFAWAVVKLYEEGSIVLWDGDVRPLPLPTPLSCTGPSFLLPDGETSGLWKTGNNTIESSRMLSSTASANASTSLLYSSSHSYSYSAPAPASLLGHRSSHRHHKDEQTQQTDTDADPSYLSDAPPNEEAYVPLTPRFLAGYVREALEALRKARCTSRRVTQGTAASAFRNPDVDPPSNPTPEDIAGYLRKTDARWARVGAWAVEEALEVLNG